MHFYSAYYREITPLELWYPDFRVQAIKEDQEITPPGVLILWGGSDIHPSLYNRRNEGTSCGPVLSSRDQLETSLLYQAINKDIPIIGICRGAQLLCAAAGGILIQDVNGHNSDHMIAKAGTGEKVLSSSLHHQMMYPWAVNYELLAWSSTQRSKIYRGITEKELERIPKTADGELYEPEIVWFPEILGLAIQGHPEYQASDTPCNIFVKELIDAYIIPLVTKE